MGLIVTASDIEAEQARVLASAKEADQAVQACTGLDTGTKSQWDTFYASLTAFCQQPVCNFWYPGMPSNCLMATANTGDTMLAWANELQAWQQRIHGLCKNYTAPGLSTFNPTPFSVSQATDLIRAAAVLAGIIAVAYVVHTAAPFVADAAAALKPREKPKEME